MATSHIQFFAARATICHQLPRSSFWNILILLFNEVGEERVTPAGFWKCLGGARREPRGWTSCSYTFLCQLICQLLVGPCFVLHFLGFLVIIDSQLFQGLEHLLHLILGRLILNLESSQLLLDLLIIPPRGGQKLGRNITAALSDPKTPLKDNTEKEKNRQRGKKRVSTQIVYAGGEKSWKQQRFQHKCVWKKHKKKLWTSTTRKIFIKSYHDPRLRQRNWF